MGDKTSQQAGVRKERVHHKKGTRGVGGIVGEKKRREEGAHVMKIEYLNVPGETAMRELREERDGRLGLPAEW